jgi:hypothetical protein
MTAVANRLGMGRPGNLGALTDGLSAAFIGASVVAWSARWSRPRSYERVDPHTG